MAAKNYQAAIHDFQKALAQDPSNFRWREDLGYADLAAGSLSDARKEFEAVYRHQPNQLNIALQLGYVCQQLHQEQDAEKYFEAATRSADDGISRVARSALESLRASSQQALKQKAYDLLARNRRDEAIGLFRAGPPGRRQRCRHHNAIGLSLPGHRRHGQGEGDVRGRAQQPGPEGGAPSRERPSRGES